MSSIWVRTKSYLWGEQWGATGSHVTESDTTGSRVTRRVPVGTGSMVCACATGSFAIPLVGHVHRK